MTNKTPVGTYRGPGRFESNFFLERMLDMVAGDLGIDRVELRRRNLITHAEQPYTIAHVQPTDAKDQYDSGDYLATFERCLEEIRWDEKSELAGKLIGGLYHGLAVVNFIEGGAAGPKETARLAVNDDGTISVYLGTTFGRAGGGDDFRADCRRRAGNSDRPYPPRPSRLDVLCERRLRRVSFALDRDGRLGPA